MAIQMRRGLQSDFVPERLLAGEWAVTIDAETQRQCVYMGFGNGIYKKMGTMDTFEEWFTESFESAIEPYEEEFNEIKAACQQIKAETLAIENEIIQIKDNFLTQIIPQVNAAVDEATAAALSAEEWAEVAESLFSVDIEKIGTQGLVDTYEITYNNDKKVQFNVTNGKDGEAGDVDIATSEVAGVVKIPTDKSITIDDDGTIHATNVRGGISGDSIDSDIALLSFDEGTYSIYAPNNQFIPSDSGVITISRTGKTDGWFTVLFHSIDGRSWYRVAYSSDTWWTAWIEVSSKSDIEAINTKLTTAEGNITTLTTNVTTINTKLVDSADWLKSKNLFDKNDLSVGIISSTDGKTITVSGYESYTHTNNYIEVESGATYYFNNTSSVRFFIYNSNYELLETDTYSSPSSHTMPSNAKYVKLHGTDLASGNSLQFEKGTSATSYQPFNISNTELTEKVISAENDGFIRKNLLNPYWSTGDTSPSTFNGVTYKWEDGVLTINGTRTVETGTNFWFIPLSHFEYGSYTVTFYDNNTKAVCNDDFVLKDGVSTNTFTVSSANRSQHIGIQAKKDKAFSNSQYVVQIEKGSSATTYAPFSISNAELTEKMVSAENDGFIEENLYNYKTRTDGWILNDDGICSNSFTSAGYGFTSDFIPVSSGIYTLSFKRIDNQIYARIIGYDDNKNPISSPLLAKSTDTTPLKLITLSANVDSDTKYIRFCCTKQSEKVRFEKGTTKSNFELTNGLEFKSFHITPYNDTITNEYCVKNDYVTKIGFKFTLTSATTATDTYVGIVPEGYRPSTDAFTFTSSGTIILRAYINATTGLITVRNMTGGAYGDATLNFIY